MIKDKSYYLYRLFCVSLNTRITFSNVSEIIPTLDTLHSSLDFTNKKKSVFFKINNAS